MLRTDRNHTYDHSFHRYFSKTRNFPLIFITVLKTNSTLVGEYSYREGRNIVTKDLFHTE